MTQDPVFSTNSSQHVQNKHSQKRPISEGAPLLPSEHQYCLSYPLKVGTDQTPFQAYSEKDRYPFPTNNVFLSISAMPTYLKCSPEELRMADYEQGRRFGREGRYWDRG